MVSNLNLAYASVLFDVGLKQNKLPAFLDMAQEVLNVFKRNPKLSNVLNDLSVEKEDRKELISSIWEKKLDIEFIYFLWAVIDFNRTRHYSDILKHFLDIGQKHFHISYFKVTSAYKLDRSEMNALRKVILLKFNRKNIIVSNKVDPSVIGGIKIQSHSHSIDATIKNKLNLMRESTRALDHNRR